MGAERSFIIWGAGGHGRVVADLVISCGHRVVGFADGDVSRLGESIHPFGVEVVLEEDALCRETEEAPRFDAIALGVGSNRARAAFLGRVRLELLPPLVHPAAWVSGSAHVAEGAGVFPRAVVHTSANVGRGVIVNSGAVIEHDCVLAESCHVSPGAVLAGGVSVGAEAWIGAGAVVLEGLSVGRGAVVGAGSVVIRDVPPDTTVAGVPARQIGSVAP